MFSAITQPKYPNAALGIEADQLSAVAISGGRRQYSIKQAATVGLMPGVLDPNFVNENIVDDREFSASLREVVESAGLLRQKRWSIALPSGTARSAILALDSEPASRSEADQVLDWKAEQSWAAAG